MATPSDGLNPRSGKTPPGGAPQPVPQAAPRGPLPQPSVAPRAAFPTAAPSTAARYVRKKKPLWKSPVAWLLLFAVGGAAAGGWWTLSRRSLVLPSPGEQLLGEAVPFAISLRAETKNLAPNEVKYELVAGPEGAQLDPQTGAFAWTPTERQGPGRYDVRIRAAAVDDAALNSAAAFAVVVDETNAEPKLEAVADQTLDLTAAKSLRLQLQATDADLPPQKLSYLLVDAPSGGSIDAAGGTFTFDAAAAKPGQTPSFTVAVRDDAGGTSSPVTFRISVVGLSAEIEKFTARATAVGQKLLLLGTEPAPLFAVPGKVFSLGSAGNRLTAYEFASSGAAAEASAAVLPDASEIGDKPVPFAKEAKVFLSGTLLFVFLGTDALPAPLADLLGRKIADRTPAVLASVAPSMPSPTAAEPAKSATSEFQPLVDLYKRKKLFSPKEYATLRKFYADRFAAAHADVIRQTLGDDATLTALLDKNPDIREELYTALDPEHDDVAAALGIFKELHRRFPAKFKAYAQLAIAVAVTWDVDRNVYAYANHQTRVHALMPEPLAGAVDNFKYFLDAESIMQGRAQHLPWEFLVHAVNDRTPIAERVWAVNRYLPKRVMFGDCYSQVPYDHEMLRTDDRVCRLDGKPYTLENLLQFGGVCAQQADFAARVGKAMGVPAEYVSGEGIQQGLHAWVMWIELKQATPNGIVFSLESHGRYGSDFYYVGRLRDPQTGERITDRQLELRLQTVGMNVPAKRQSKLVMAAYPALRDELKLPVKEQMEFLSDAIQLCVGNEEAWHALAKIAKEADIKKADEKVLVTAIDALFRTFTRVPDFTWEVFDDLIGFRKDPKERIALYQRLVQLYDQAKRPDLACQAATVLARMMGEADRKPEACQALMATILRYPTEGRYVPKLVDQIDEMSQGLPNADQQMAGFYVKFLPTIPKARIDEPSAYAIAMHEKGIAKFRALGMAAEAAAAETELAKIRAIGK